jgi:hypothetical protein
MKKLIFSFVILLTLGLSRGNAQQHYIRLDDFSGLNTDAYQSQLEAEAKALINTFPATLRDSFKVIDFGFYLQNQHFEGSYPSVFQDAIKDAAKKSKYFLLFGKQTDDNGIYTKFWVEIRLPNYGSFSCFHKGNSLAILEEQIRLETENYYNKQNKFHYTYSIAEIYGMQALKGQVSKITQCCVNGQLTGCGSCVFNMDEMGVYLFNQGFVEIEFSDATITPYGQYNYLNSAVRITLKSKENTTVTNYTDRLNEDLGILASQGGVTSRVTVFNEQNCDGFQSFLRLPNAANLYTQDIVVLQFGGKIRIFSDVTADKDAMRSGSFGSRSIVVPQLVYMILRELAMAGLEVLMEIGTETAFEYLMTDVDTWEKAFAACDWGNRKLELANIAWEGVKGGQRLQKLKTLTNIFWHAYQFIRENQNKSLREIFDNVLNRAFDWAVGVVFDQVFGKINKIIKKYSGGISFFRSSGNGERGLVSRYKKLLTPKKEMFKIRQYSLRFAHNFF